MKQIQPREVARTQKRLLWAILAQIIMSGVFFYMQFAPPDLPEEQAVALALGLLVVRLAVIIMAIAFLMMMMSALQRPLISRILAGVSQVIPLVNLIVLVCVNQSAVSVLQRAGYRVGLMGAKM